MPINYTRFWQLQVVMLGLVAFGFAWMTEHEKTMVTMLQKLRDDITQCDDKYRKRKLEKLEKHYGTAKEGFA